MEAIMTAIATLGFPIVACLGLGYFCYTIVNKMIEVIETNTKALTAMREEISDLTRKGE